MSPCVVLNCGSAEVVFIHLKLELDFKVMCINPSTTVARFYVLNALAFST